MTKKYFGFNPLNAAVATMNTSVLQSCNHGSGYKSALTTAAIPWLVATGALLNLPDKTQCDSSSTTMKDENETGSNPLWPSGVSSDMVNLYVDELLADPNINMKFVPDSIERIMYVSTVRMTINVVYETVSTFHDTELLGHVMKLQRNRDADLQLAHSDKQMNIKILEAVADDLLRKKSINQFWIPDFIERQIYANCLFVVFTILNKVAENICVRVCGHELNLVLEPISQDRARELAQRRVVVDNIDRTALDAIVQDMVEESLQTSTTVTASILARLPLYASLLKALHKTLYSLTLGIVEDVLSKTEITILKERIQVKLVPFRENFLPQSGEHKQRELEKELKEVKSREARTRRTATAVFLASIAFALASSSRRQ